MLDTCLCNIDSLKNMEAGDITYANVEFSCHICVHKCESEPFCLQVFTWLSSVTVW